jgi:hypothetical protein
LIDEEKISKLTSYLVKARLTLSWQTPLEGWCSLNKMGPWRSGEQHFHSVVLRNSMHSVEFPYMYVTQLTMLRFKEFPVHIPQGILHTYTGHRIFRKKNNQNLKQDSRRVAMIYKREKNCLQPKQR